MTRPLPGWTKPVAEQLSDRLEDLLGPGLPERPACAGRAPDFDDEVHGETATQRTTRHARAIATCHGCPALLACIAMLPNLPTNTTGAWAGRLLDGRRRRTET